MTIHNILPAASMGLTLITLGFSYFVRRWSLSTAALLLVPGTALIPAFYYFATLRSQHLSRLTESFRLGTAGELLCAVSILFFSTVFARKDPMPETLKMGIPLALATLGIFYSLNEVFYNPQLFRVLVLPQTRSVLLIDNTALNTVGFFLIGTLLLSIFQMAKTYNSAGGLDRWNLKYPLIGVFLWSLSLITVHANQILNNGFDRSFLLFEHVSLILLDGFFLYAFAFQKAKDVTLALSRNTINRSLLILFGGAGLVVFGGLGSSLGSLGPTWSKISSSLMVFLGIAAFVVVFTSDHLRREMEGFLGGHFYSNRYDYRAAWMTLTQAMAATGTLRDFVPTLMEQTREMTQAQSLSYGQIMDAPHPTVSIQDSLGWSSPRNERNLLLQSETISILSRGLPLHAGDPETRKEGSLWSPLFQALNATWILPLVFQGKLMGLVGLDTRSSGGKDLFEERLFLQALGVQWVGLLVSATQSREMAWNREADLLSGLRASTFHDFKNAGVALKLLIHNAHRNIDSPEFQKELLFCLQNISQQIDSSMEQILSPFHHEYIKVSSYIPADIIRTTVRALKWDDTPEFSLVLDLDDIPEAFGNPKVLETTLRNLLINAREAMENKGEIRITIRKDGTSFTLSVTDNGPGMSRDFQENHLFRPFQTTKKKGTGLGLFSSKLLIEQSGGAIHVRSKEGEGTEFLITLPLGQSPLSKNVKIPDTQS